ncbi:MAG: DUF547 domain-containing protein [Ignavibacteriae bacterium]|nr:DUF547 domain-containing protein [Ignavibacteriota bacterium]
MKYTLILLLTVFTLTSCKQEEIQRNILPETHYDFTEMDNFFKKYVSDGKVKYAEVKNDMALEKIKNDLKNFEPYAISDDKERLAFWINVYNIYTIDLITQYYPLNSILEIEERSGTNPWNMEFIEMAGGRKYSLDEIEKEIIIPKYNEPRIHYALVCAAESCPVIIAEAYTPEKLVNQFDTQAGIFLNDKSKNYLDRKDNALYLSMIYKWYGRDFIKKDSSVVDHVKKYINESDREFINLNDTKQLEYLDYSWKLNDYSAK